MFRTYVYVSGNTEQNIDLCNGRELLGDVDLDGDVDYDDYNLMIEYIKCLITLSELQMKNADINGDGVVDAMDALYLELYLNGVNIFP